MTTLMHLLLAAGGFALLSARPAWWCPAARTPRQQWAAARAAGPYRTALAGARLLLILTLLLLAEVCRLIWAAARGAGWVLAVLAYGLDALVEPVRLEVTS